MNCLVCGHKLAIFRKLSLGDFCCQEHRSLFLKEQNDRGLARLMEPKALREIGRLARACTRTSCTKSYRFSDGTDWRGYGPMAQIQVIGPERQHRPFSRLAPGVPAGMRRSRGWGESANLFRDGRHLVEASESVCRFE